MKTLEILALVLPDNPGAALLLLLGIVLFIIEFHAPTFGLLGVGGVACFMTGIFMLVDAVGADAAGIDMGVLYGIGAVGIAMAAGVGWLGWKATRRRASTGVEGMTGSEAVVKSWSETKGRVHIQGEDWAAISETTLSLSPGDRVAVVAVENLTLKITPLPRA